MDTIELRWCEAERLSLMLPRDGRVVVQSDVRPPEPVLARPAAIRKGLEEPIASLRLRELVGPETTIALVMDDVGRPTPMSRLESVVLDALIEAGTSPENITGLFAVGAHRTMCHA